MIGIYKITSPTKKVYIGQSVNIEKRFKRYKNLHCKGQRIIYNSFLKYGVENHKFEILCECEINELNDKERYYQDLYNAVGKNGLNCRLTTSSDRSGKLSEETINKLIESQKNRKVSEETKLKLSIINKGKKHKQETIIKMKLSNKKHFLGKKHSDNSLKKMSEIKKKIILNTETGIYYFGVEEAGFSLNLNKFSLAKKLNGNSKNTTPLIYV